MGDWCRRKARTGALCVFVSAALFAAGCGGSSHGGSPTTASGPPVKGGEVSFALPAGNSPNMILPFFGAAYIGNANTMDFMALMYRPLYYLDGQTFQLDEEKSLAAPPVYNSARTAVTIQMKRWHWSDGEPVSPKDVAFFIALAKTETANWWAAVPGLFPANVKSVSYDDAANSFTLHLTGPVNPDWFTYNQLSLIQPMPLAWDITGPGKKANCTDEDVAAEASECPKVYNYLESQAKSTSTYGTNKLWQVVNGPWRLKSFSPGGTSVVLVPNTSYSGSDKPHISEFQLESFTSEQAEYNVLRSGTSLTVGYLPFIDAPQKPTDGAGGPNPVSGYNLEPWFSWALNYINVNFNNPVTGPVEHQLYFRQALQYLTDQNTWIKDAYNGYAAPDFGGVPNQPSTPYLTSYVQNAPYGFDVAKAKSLITSHGWTISGSGPATCTSPGTGSGECGAGVKAGTPLSFSLTYPAGQESVSTELQDYQSKLREVGIQVTLRTLPLNALFATALPCTPKQSTCNWGMVDFGGPDSYDPFWYPDDGLEFSCGAPANTSSYCNPALDKIYANQVYRNPGLAALHEVENLVTQDAAFVFIPVPDGQLTEVRSNLGGYTQSGTMAIAPEDWYFTSGS